MKPIARSISWLVEPVVVQNIRKNRDACNIVDVKNPPHDLTPYDCIINFRDDPTDYYVNIKTSLDVTDSGGNFDISKAPKLVAMYKEIPNLFLIIVVIKVKLDGVRVSFERPILFNVAWAPHIYYNRANHNLQSKADGTQTLRTNEEFIKELQKLMKAAGHLEHY